MKDKELRKVLQKGNVIYGIGDGDGSFEVRRVLKNLELLEEKVDTLIDYLGLKYKSFNPPSIEKKT